MKRRLYYYTALQNVVLDSSWMAACATSWFAAKGHNLSCIHNMGTARSSFPECIPFNIAAYLLLPWRLFTWCWQDISVYILQVIPVIAHQVILADKKENKILYYMLPLRKPFNWENCHSQKTGDYFANKIRLEYLWLLVYNKVKGLEWTIDQ